MKLYSASGTENGTYNATAVSSIQCYDARLPCRTLAFVDNGTLLCTGSTDASIVVVDVESEKEIGRIHNAHDSEVTKMISTPCQSSSILASGDDAGNIKFWDLRQQKSVATADAHTDYVSDMTAYGSEEALLSTSGDGTMSMMDLKKFKVRHTTESDADDDLLSVAVVHCGKKVVCGTTSGVLNIYSWGFWNDCSDRFPGHPDSVTSIVPFDEEIVFTGSSDGIIRILNIQPNKLLGVCGEHSDFDVEKLALSYDRKRLASISHDTMLKIWNTEFLFDDDGEDDDDNDEDNSDRDYDTNDNTTYLGTNAVEKDFPDVEREAGDDSDDETDDEEDGKTKRRRRKKSKNKGAHKIPKKEQHKKKSNSFFSDLL